MNTLQDQQNNPILFLDQAFCELDDWFLDLVDISCQPASECVVTYVLEGLN